MHRNGILAATDFSEAARNALRAAARLATQWNLPLTIIHCLEWPDAPLSHYDEIAAGERIDDFQREGMERLRGELDGTVPEPIRPDTVHFDVSTEAAKAGIGRKIEENDYELVVLGATGRSPPADLLLGSVPSQIVRRSPAPVLVVEEGADVDAHDHIVAPIDLSDCSRASLERAIDFARREGAALTAVHAIPAAPEADDLPIPNVPNEQRLHDFRSEQLEAFLADFSFEGLDWDVQKFEGTPFDVIVGSIREVHADLAVLGTHGRSHLERLVLGGTTDKVLRKLPCSIMTVRAPKN